MWRGNEYWEHASISPIRDEDGNIKHFVAIKEDVTEDKGSDIPVFGRIVAIADVFDALTSERPYKRAWPVAEAVEEIVHCSEQHFDPQIVDAFLRVIPELTAVRKQFADEEK